MDNRTKFYLLIGPTLLSFIYAATSPTIQIYFMKLVSSEVLAIAGMITVGLAAIVNTTVTSDKAKEWYRNHFVAIVVVDVACFTAISYGSLLDVTIRFLGFAVLNAVSTTLWYTVMSNAVNRILSGDVLTSWNAFEKSLELYGSLAGGLIAVLNMGISLEVCITLQCVANFVMGCTDLQAYRMLKRIDIS